MGAESENKFLTLDMIEKVEPVKDANRRVHSQSSKRGKKVFMVTFRRNMCRARGVIDRTRRKGSVMTLMSSR